MIQAFVLTDVESTGNILVGTRCAFVVVDIGVMGSFLV